MFGYGLWSVSSNSVSLDPAKIDEPPEITIFERFNDFICEIPPTIVSQKVSSLAVGAAHLLLLTEAGRVYCRGDNRFGQLGLGSRVRHTFDLEPVADLSEKHIDQVNAVGLRSAAITREGRLYVWGGMRLDDGDIDITYDALSSPPSLVDEYGAPFCVLQAQLSHGHTAVLAHHQSQENRRLVYTWGSNKHGQLGHGDRAPRIYPTLVAALQRLNIKYISSGPTHMAAIAGNLRLYVWGTIEDPQNPAAATNLLGISGHGPSVLTPRVMPYIKAVHRVRCGDGFTLAVCGMRSCWAWGRSGSGICGSHHAHAKPHRLPGLSGAGVESLSVGQHHAFVSLGKRSPTNKSGLMSWGANFNNLLAQDAAEVFSPTPSAATRLESSNVSLFACGDTSFFSLVTSRSSPDDELLGDEPDETPILEEQGLNLTDFFSFTRALRPPPTEPSLPVAPMSSSRHQFIVASFSTQTFCSFCHSVLWGLIKQGVKCKTCGFIAHSKCVAAVNVHSPCLGTAVYNKPIGLFVGELEASAFQRGESELISLSSSSFDQQTPITKDAQRAFVLLATPEDAIANAAELLELLSRIVEASRSPLLDNSTNAAGATLVHKLALLTSRLVTELNSSSLLPQTCHALSEVITALTKAFYLVTTTKVRSTSPVDPASRDSSRDSFSSSSSSSPRELASSAREPRARSPIRRTDKKSSMGKSFASISFSSDHPPSERHPHSERPASTLGASSPISSSTPLSASVSASPTTGAANSRAGPGRPGPQPAFVVKINFIDDPPIVSATGRPTFRCPTSKTIALSPLTTAQQAISLVLKKLFRGLPEAEMTSRLNECSHMSFFTAKTSGSRPQAIPGSEPLVKFDSDPKRCIFLTSSLEFLRDWERRTSLTRSDKATVSENVLEDAPETPSGKRAGHLLRLLKKTRPESNLSDQPANGILIAEKDRQIEELRQQLANIPTPVQEEPPEEADAFAIDIDPTQVEILEFRAHGTAGDVYRGRYLFQDVAIKFLRDPTPEMLKDFREEILLMRRIKTKQVVYFYGVTSKPKPCLVMEWCGFGSLTDVLRNPDETIAWPEFFSFGTQMLQSVYALHMREPPIVHRDLKSLNYLVDRYYCIKLCDFGLARQTQQKGTTIRESLAEELRNTRGTYEYLAPEIYSGEMYSEKSDIYSLAIILWEIVNRCLKREWMKPYGDQKMIPAALYIGVAKRGNRPRFPDNCPTPITQLISAAWSTDPAARPTIDLMLKGFLALQELYESNTPEWDQLITPPEEPVEVAVELPNDDDDQVRKTTSSMKLLELAISSADQTDPAQPSSSNETLQKDALLSQYKALMEKFPNDLSLFERMLRRLAEKLENASEQNKTTQQQQQ